MYNVRVYKTKIFSQILILLKVWRSPYIRVTLKAASKHIIMLRQSIKLRAKKTLNQATGGINQRPLMPCSRACTRVASIKGHWCHAVEHAHNASAWELFTLKWPRPIHVCACQMM